MDSTNRIGTQLRLRDGTPVRWRFVVPSDRPAFEAGFASLPAHTRYLRFHQHINELPEQLWDGLDETANSAEPRRHVALLLYAGTDPIGVCHVIRSEQDWHTADVSVTIAEDWQGRGAAGLLLGEALYVAGDVHRIDTQVMLDNTAAIRMLESIGEIEFSCVQGHCQAVVTISAAAAA
ncbi:MAG: GNAT family N-acetyltransferase [Jatrophihabitans sp.]